MKLAIGFIAVFVFGVFVCHSEQSVTLAWDANPETDIGGYIVYYGVASRNYTNAVNVGNVTTNTVFGLVDGVTYYFAVTAYNTNGLESEYSQEVSYARPPGIVMRAIPPVFTKSNVVLRGTTTYPDLSFWFDVSPGIGTTNWTRAQALPPTNGIYWAELFLAQTNWTCRFVGSNSNTEWLSPTINFSTIQPRKPTGIRFKVQLIQSSSISGPWKESMQASLLVPYPPSQDQSFYRSLLSWTPEYEP